MYLKFGRELLLLMTSGKFGTDFKEDPGFRKSIHLEKFRYPPETQVTGGLSDEFELLFGVFEFSLTFPISSWQNKIYFCTPQSFSVRLLDSQQQSNKFKTLAFQLSLKWDRSTYSSRSQQ